MTYVPTQDQINLNHQFGYIDVLKGVYVGRDGHDSALTFFIGENGPGEYSFESAQLPGYFLTVDDNIDASRAFLA